MDDRQLRVAVVGAGIAGLTVAVALRRAGVQCEVFERAGELREVGAGIQLSPNGTRPLYRLGLGDALDAVAVHPQATEMRRWHDGSTLLRTELGAACREMYQAPYLSLHRADLHRALLAEVADTPMYLDHECVDIRELPDAVELRFAGGSRTTADVVVGADGIRSAVREALVTDQPRFSGQAVYRGLVPAGRLPEVVAEPAVRIWLGPGRHCVYYPVSGGRQVSFVATAPAGAWRTESWTEPGEVADLLAGYEGWHDEVRRVLGAADQVTRWAVHDRDTLDQWSTRRTTLVGDAAHPMLPFGAQGASQGIEDAVALAACLRQVPPDDISVALKRYEQVRLPRTGTVHRTMRENARNHHYSDGMHQRERDQAMSDRWGLLAQSWLYGYDAEEAATE